MIPSEKLVKNGEKHDYNIDDEAGHLGFHKRRYFSVYSECIIMNLYTKEQVDTLFKMQLTINAALQMTIKEQANKINRLEEMFSGLVSDFNKFEDILSDEETPNNLGIPSSGTGFGRLKDF